MQPNTVFEQYETERFPIGRRKRHWKHLSGWLLLQLLDYAYIGPAVSVILFAGSLAIVLLIIAVILTIKACKIIHYKRIERSNKKREEQSRDNRDKIENNLIQEYAASQELRKALNVILQGNMSNRPSEITISSRG